MIRRYLLDTGIAQDFQAEEWIQPWQHITHAVH